MTAQAYYVVDLRPESSGEYICFWRADNRGYAWPLSWAGKYDKETIDKEASYYCNTNGTDTLMRFPVACEAVEAMGLIQPRPGVIDGNAGPVLRNSAATRRKLRKLAYIPVGAVVHSASGVCVLEAK